MALRLKLPAAVASLLGLSHPAEPPRPPPPPSSAEDACAACPTPSLDLEIPFAFAEAGLTETAQVRLAEVGAWLWRHPGAQVRLVVMTEPHYKRPDIERDLAAARRQTVVAYLHDRGVAAERLIDTEDSQPSPASVRLTLRGRGW